MFLTVFALVNVLAVRRGAGEAWVSIAGAVGAILAVLVLAAHLAGFV